ncbi:MAG: RNA pyrophosphohydrolase, partial [Dongiaceae bacterium]
MAASDVTRLPYRRGVGIMLLNPRGEVFVARRIDMPSDAWQMPQGGIDEGETPEAAAWREMAEETGTSRAELLAESRDWLRYDLPPELIPRLWQGRFRGQEQK